MAMVLEPAIRPSGNTYFDSFAIRALCLSKCGILVLLRRTDRRTHTVRAHDDKKILERKITSFLIRGALLTPSTHRTQLKITISIGYLCGSE